MDRTALYYIAERAKTIRDAPVIDRNPAEAIAALAAIIAELVDAIADSPHDPSK